MIAFSNGLQPSSAFRDRSAFGDLDHVARLVLAFSSRAYCLTATQSAVDHASRDACNCSTSYGLGAYVAHHLPIKVRLRDFFF
jgi:hypothetical protein